MRRIHPVIVAAAEPRGDNLREKFARHIFKHVGRMDDGVIDQIISEGRAGIHSAEQGFAKKE